MCEAPSPGQSLLFTPQRPDPSLVQDVLSNGLGALSIRLSLYLSL